MATATGSDRRIPVTAVSIALLSLMVLAAALYYLNRAPKPAAEASEASADAKNYLAHLQLSDVNMQATENFMHQQVIEIQGKIANTGVRKLGLIEVYCSFSGMDGKEVYRERLAITHSLAPNETRPFRLPFDSVPDGWNQAMPRLIIARIAFAS